MTTIRRLAWLVFGVACTHLVFGAIVRISGSGMGCGPHWPKCYGAWFPPMSRPDLVIEVTHRYLASVLLLSLIVLVAAAFRRRHEPGVGGRGGVLRMATLAMSLGFGAAVLGAVTVKLANSAPATVAHWTVAMSLVAAVTATVIRAGGLGGNAARRGGASRKARRGTLAGAAMALAAVVMGGLTAKVQGGPIACLAFPLCGANPLVPRGAVHVQTTHRVIAVLLVLHLVGLFFAFRKRREPAVIRRAVAIALGLGVLQLLIAGAMIGLHLPPALRSLHEATGVSIWIATFALAYLSRLASDEPGPDTSTGDPLLIPLVPLELGMTAASVRASVVSRPTFASAVVARGSSRPASRYETERLPTPVAGMALVSMRDSMAPTTTYASSAATTKSVEVTLADVSDESALPISLPVTLGESGPLELSDALELGSRVALDSALAFHRVAARAVVVFAEILVTSAEAGEAQTGGRELVKTRGESGVAAVVPVVTVAPVAPVATVAPVVTGAPVAPVVSVATVHQTAEYPVEVEADARAAVAAGIVVGVDAMVQPAPVSAVEEVRHGARAMMEGVGGPPSEHDIAERAELCHHGIASVIEVSRGSESAEPAARDDAAMPAIYARPSSAGLTSLAEISARRRPSMSHSIAVIVARGADV